MDNQADRRRSGSRTLRHIGGEAYSSDPSQTADREGHRSPGRGKLYLVGLGAGSPPGLTPRAREVIEAADVVIGYQRYIDLLGPLVAGKEIISSAMGGELGRAKAAIPLVKAGKTVAVVSSGDAGIYGCAGPAIETLRAEGELVPLEVIPGVTAASLAAAALGAPLMNDFAVISLSDLLTPWETIEKRLQAVAAADMVLVIYNPKSQGRDWQLGCAREILLQYRPASTPVGIVREVGRPEEKAWLTDLKHLGREEVDMLCTVIVGNTQSFVYNGFFVTKRGYSLT